MVVLANCQFDVQLEWSALSAVWSPLRFPYLFSAEGAASIQPGAAPQEWSRKS
jgi:hypothetical protein